MPEMLFSQREDGAQRHLLLQTGERHGEKTSPFKPSDGTRRSIKSEARAGTVSGMRAIRELVRLVAMCRYDTSDEEKNTLRSSATIKESKECHQREQRGFAN